MRLEVCRGCYLWGRWGLVTGGRARRGAAAARSPGSPLPASASGAGLGGSCWHKSTHENQVFLGKCLLPTHNFDLDQIRELSKGEIAWVNREELHGCHRSQQEGFSIIQGFHDLRGAQWRGVIAVTAPQSLPHTWNTENYRLGCPEEMRSWNPEFMASDLALTMACTCLLLKAALTRPWALQSSPLTFTGWLVGLTTTDQTSVWSVTIFGPTCQKLTSLRMTNADFSPKCPRPLHRLVPLNSCPQLSPSPFTSVCVHVPILHCHRNTDLQAKKTIWIDSSPSHLIKMQLPHVWKSIAASLWS